MTAIESSRSHACSVELERPETVWWNTRPGLTHQIDYGDWRAEMHSTRRCSVDECDRAHYGKGYCRKHWERYHRHGDPLTVGILVGASVAERLRHYSRAEGDCTVWTGRRNAGGYGQIQIDGKPVAAHRAAYKEAHGAIPEGLVVRHKCDNPPCINADHLEVGTHDDNQRDKVERNRSTYGERNPSAKLSPVEVELIRRLADSGVRREEIEQRFSIGKSQVARILRGESWAR